MRIAICNECRKDKSLKQYKRKTNTFNCDLCDAETKTNFRIELEKYKIKQKIFDDN
tara:strand:- start:457 stop:624 length:168 start_codon:yes stop_codon:yes gene_type:complete